MPFGVCPFASSGVVRSERSVSVVGRFVTDDPDVERSMEQDDEEASIIAARLMPHGLAGREVRVCSGTDHSAVGVEAAFEYDDRVRGGVRVGQASQARWVADQVVLLARGGVLVKQPKPDRSVVDGRRRTTRWRQLERPELVDDHSGSKVHGHMIISMPYASKGVRPHCDVMS